jgi:hypothetical protein
MTPQNSPWRILSFIKQERFTEIEEKISFPLAAPEQHSKIIFAKVNQIFKN